MQGVQAQPQKFWFVKNFCKTSENLGKIPENPGKSCDQRCLTSKMAPNVCRKAQLRPFFGGHTINRSSCSLWDKICGQKAHKNFSGKLGEIGAKILRTPKICLLLHLWLHWLGVKATMNLVFLELISIRFHWQPLK